MDSRTLVITIMLCAYLIGSIPFSQIITRWRAGVDLRAVGEGNVGSRNVWHVVGPQWGVIAAIFDVLKGFLVCWAASALTLGASLAVALAGVAVILGHQFSIYLRGRGGKGLNTALGVLLFLAPLPALTGLAVLGVSYLILRNFNRCIAVAIIALIFLPVLYRQPLWIAVYTLGLALLAALKKRLDYSHDMRVWANSPWQGTATPGFSNSAHPAGEDSAPDVRPR
ncbi:MAG TPA: glycerol-3-phosphate acyltransferase [Ktedonobacterales bacterium]|nr:glycerol-3-phosphate acyltransferase [Ktedonobacterales bacterium]